jgi:hypothetical protein
MIDKRKYADGSDFSGTIMVDAELYNMAVILGIPAHDYWEESTANENDEGDHPMYKKLLIFNEWGVDDMKYISLADLLKVLLKGARVEE